MGPRILFVTGKGGTGKSSIAAALAREAAARGRRVLLVRMPPAARAGESDAGHDGKRARGGRSVAGATLREKTLDDERDLEAFLTRILGFGFLARRLCDSRTFSAVAAAAPGLRDLVALTAITTEAGRRRGLVVVDAPATGHSLPMLTAPARGLELAPLGPVANEARRALAVLADRRAFAAVLVTAPEELAITEVLALHEQVVGAGAAAAHVVVNGMWPAYVSAADGERIAASGVSADAARHWQRHQRHARLVDELEARVGPCARIGFSFGDEGLPRGDVGRLLDTLTEAAA